MNLLGDLQVDEALERSKYDGTYGSYPHAAASSLEALYQSQVRSVAADAIFTLKAAGVKDACFVGGMACYLFGNSRKPNDLDILCLGSALDQEGLKRKLVSLNSKFYLVAARDPSAKYKVLWYLTDTGSRIKVDLLFPGVLDIPNIPPSCITRTNIYSLPCAPLSLILLLKLQAWIHHGDSLHARYFRKKPTDASDINALLSVANAMGLKPRTEKFLPVSFVETSESRVKRYVREVPTSAGQWRDLDYDVVVTQKPAVVQPTLLKELKPRKPDSYFARVNNSQHKRHDYLI